MKQHTTGLLALVVALGAVGLHFWQRAPKIAYAETSVLLSEFSEAVKAKRQFEEAQKGWDGNLAKLNDSLTAGMDRMKRGYDQANAKTKDSLRADLQRRNEDLQRYANAVKKMSQDKEKELMDPVIKKMNGFLAQWGKGHGYDLILGTVAGGSILQANPQFNLTDRILQDMNSEYKELPVSNPTPEEKKSPPDSLKSGSVGSGASSSPSR
jgi:outer membrane protein